MLRSAIVATCFSLVATAAFAQVTPAAGYTPPDDTPAVTVGATIFTNYGYQTNPSITDTDGNSVKKSAFDVARSYININGRISHVVSFRITPDIARESSLVSLTSPNSVSTDSLVFRVKYAFLQTNFDDWMTRGSWARIGIQQTPYIDYTEGIYRYRFQGTTFIERIGELTSSDAGVSFHYNLPSNYGEIHVGVYNGEFYSKPEVNDQKGIQIRGTIRPFATMAPIARGFRATVFYVGDDYVKNGERKRFVGQTTFEHKYAVAGFEYIDAKDQASALPGAVDKHGKGWALWATPKAPMTNGSSWEALLRYDHYVPDERTSFSTAAAPNATTPFNTQEQNRIIAGVAYWFPHTGGPTAALLLDYDGQSFKNISTAPVKVVALHALLNF